MKKSSKVTKKGLYKLQIFGICALNITRSLATPPCNISIQIYRYIVWVGMEESWGGWGGGKQRKLASLIRKALPATDETHLRPTPLSSFNNYLSHSKLPVSIFLFLALLAESNWLAELQGIFSTARLESQSPPRPGREPGTTAGRSRGPPRV